MSFFCKLFGCKTSCDSVRKEEQEICTERINSVHKDHEDDFIQMVKDKNTECEARIKTVHKQHDEVFLSMVKNKDFEINKWIGKYNEEKKIPKMPDFCKPDECPFKPNGHGNGNDKKLSIKNKQTYYGDKPIKLVGCSRFMALFLDHDPVNWPNWGVSGLAEYENVLINSGINYVRHAMGKDMNQLRSHCELMRKHGIIVEIGLYCEHISDRMGDPFEAVDATIDLPNVFYDCHNEFVNVDDVKKVQGIVRHVKDKGGICSAGAWGNSTHGLEYSNKFDPINSNNDIVSVHRQWTQDWITRYMAYKPVVRNEYFDRKGTTIGFAGMKRIMKETVEAGAGCQYYMFNDNIWKERLKWAGEYCRELNQ